MKCKLRRYAVPILMALAIPILLTRCTPAWLPDSKRFVYAGADGSVDLYNIETKEKQQIARLKFPAAGVAVFPGGERIAVVHYPQGDEPKMQVSVFDLKGKRLHDSGEHDIGGLGGGDGKLMHLLSTHVSPDGKHLIAFMPGNGGAVTYDLQRKKFRNIPKLMPIGLFAGMAASAGREDQKYLPMAFDVPAVTPDGKGFVAMRESEDNPFVYYQWDRDEPTRLELSAEDRDTLKTSFEAKDKDKAIGVATMARWQGDALVMHLQGSELRLNPGVGKCSVETTMASDALLQHATRQKATVIAKLDRDTILQLQDAQLQIWRRNRGAITLLERQEDGGILGVSPAPDGRSILVRSIASGKDVVQVFNVQGEKLAELKQASVLP